MIIKISAGTFVLIGLLLLVSCSDREIVSAKKPLFTLMSPWQTKVDFTNIVTEGLNTNVLMYEYFYNGGGVSIADFNNDGLDDIYFTANMTDNKLYLNEGVMKFKDVTSVSGTSGRPGPWKTGVTVADVNADGRSDIFVCYSGNMRGEKRVNQLFINEGNDEKGIPRFIDRANEFGLADSAFTVHAAFFDYDRDNDLDVLIINHNPAVQLNPDESMIRSFMKQSNMETGTKLYENTGNRFINVSAEAGIRSTLLSHGLGVGVSDINTDGWPDLYISNDFMEPDYLYINNGDKTFTDRLDEYLGHTSHFSMGNDVADINNDEQPDIITLDMLPEDNHRQKTLSAPENYELFDQNVRVGFHHQYMRNMLHLNNGNGTFSEIGQLSGVSNTDWSWAPLFADFDNDGWKDLFVTNGFVRDYTNMDFTKYMGDFLQNRKVMRKDLLELVKKMPSSRVKNYMYRNNRDLTFSNVRNEWGFDISSNSNGAAYGDLDNDGDLDLVVNNVNEVSFIYRNNLQQDSARHYLQLKLEGGAANRDGIGAKVIMYQKGASQYFEQMPSRGFQSSVSSILHFGLGDNSEVDSLRVIWQSGMQQILRNIEIDQRIVLKEQDVQDKYLNPSSRSAVFVEAVSPVKYTDANYRTNDFKRQPLLVNPLSYSGPVIVKGDLNNDSLEDIFIGGGNGQNASVIIQHKNGSFTSPDIPVFNADKFSEDAAAVIFDANNDGYNDIYVASGGYSNYKPDDERLKDRLYINSRNGSFMKSEIGLPEMRGSKGCVSVAYINNDSFPDIFVGGRVIPGSYPEIPSSYILINDGKGKFADQTAEIAPSLKKLGHVTDASWADLDKDGKDELIVVGEWMPVCVFANTEGKLEDVTQKYFSKLYTGWWNKLLTGDFNKDGRVDIVVGNQGTNTQFKASEQEPVELYYKDFDDNGSIDPILCFYIMGQSYPYVFRDELLDQLSILRTRFPDYTSYADAKLENIFTAQELAGAKKLQAVWLRTTYFELDSDDVFQERKLPVEVQVSPVFAIAETDYDNDGNSDLLFCGNIEKAKVRFGKYDANYGVLIKGDGKGNFSYVDQKKSGFRIKGDVRSVVSFSDFLLFGINRSSLIAYKRQKNNR